MCLLGFLEPVFIGRNTGWVRDFFARRSQFDADVLEVRQGELTKYGGKRPAQTVLSACEYRFLTLQAHCTEEEVILGRLAGDI